MEALTSCDDPVGALNHRLGEPSLGKNTISPKISPFAISFQSWALLSHLDQTPTFDLGFDEVHMRERLPDFGFVVSRKCSLIAFSSLHKSLF